MTGYLMVGVPLMLFALSAQAQMHRWTDANGVVHFSDRVPANAGKQGYVDTRQLERDRTSQRQSGAVLAGMDANSWQRLHTYLNSRHFYDVEQILFNARSRVASDISQEPVLADLYSVFDSGDPAMQSLFNDWVRLRSGSEYAYLARATYLVGLAQQAMQRSANDEAHNLMMAAMTDVDSALRHSPDSSIGYSLLLRASHATTTATQYDQYRQQAMQRLPQSLLVASTAVDLAYQQGLASSGSAAGGEAKARLLVRQALFHVSKNPLLVSLESRLLFLQATTAHQRGQQVRAMSQIKQALNIASSAEYLRLLGTLQLQQQHYQQALLAFDQALALRSADAASLLGRAEVYAGLNQYRNAAAELAAARRLAPNDARVAQWSAQLIGSLASLARQAAAGQNWQAALDYLDKALLINPNSGPARFERASVWYQMGNYSEAEADALVAVDARKAPIAWYRLLSDLYGKKQYWQRQQDIWSQFLQRNGDNPDALLARAEARRHNNDVIGARADVSRAANISATAAGQ